MERYDYYRVVEHDVLDYIHENLESSDWLGKRDWLEEYLDDWRLEQDPDVTGYPSNSYWGNAWEVEEALCHNTDLLFKALDNAWEPLDPENPEAMDVCIRRYVLPAATGQALDYLEKFGEVWELAKPNPCY